MLRGHLPLGAQALKGRGVGLGRVSTLADFTALVKAFLSGEARVSEAALA
jgi:hypothetical protein